MAKQLFVNNAAGKLNVGITDVATSLTLQGGQGALFPNPGAGEYFMATLIDTALNLEIVKVTARAGDTFTTIVRGQEGTTAIAFSAADRVECRVTKGTLEALRDGTLEAGTRTIFQQAAAPTGWTKEAGAAYNDCAMRITTGAGGGTGGADAFTTHFGAGKSTNGFTLTAAEIPAHAHGVNDPTHNHSVNDPTHSHGLPVNVEGIGDDGVHEGGGTGSARYYVAGTNAAATGISINGTGTGISIQNTGGGGSHAHVMANFNIKYADFVLAQRN